MLTISRRFLTHLNQCRLLKLLRVSLRGILKLHLPLLLNSSGMFRVDRSVSVVKVASRFGFIRCNFGGLISECSTHTHTPLLIDSCYCITFGYSQAFFCVSITLYGSASLYRIVDSSDRVSVAVYRTAESRFGLPGGNSTPPAQ